MPVDFVAFFLPLLTLAAVVGVFVDRRRRRTWQWAAGLMASVLVAVYFVPGWALWARAKRGNRDAQYHLGRHYQTRFGYMLSDVECRDYWWVESAKQGHPNAMFEVGYFSMIGTSRHIPKDLRAARRWMEAAGRAGDPDAQTGLDMLSKAESKPPAR